MSQQAAHASSSHPSVPASQILGALSFALDLTDGQQMGHSMQSCLVGMRIGAALGLEPTQMSDLYYALILKDAGCSSNSSRLFHLLEGDEIKAKRELKSMDWTRQGWQQMRYALHHMATGRPILRRLQHILQVARQPPASGTLYQLRCERGASIARRIGFSLEIAEAIASLDEHWDGMGYPMHLVGHEIPLLSRIMNLSQTVAVFWCQGGAKAAVAMMKRRICRWFDPAVVRAVLSLAKNGSLFLGLDDPDLVGAAARLEPAGLELSFDGQGIDRICDAFAEVIDTKSPYTFRHSAGVAMAAVAAARQLGCSEETMLLMRRAGLLHDIGKLAVPNSILEKPGKLNAGEWQIVKNHPMYSLQILERVPGFRQLSQLAAAHHERLDGKGYFRGYSAKDLSLEARILAAADMYDALAAERPYRPALPRETVFSIMEGDAPHSLDADCVRALKEAPEKALQLPQVVSHGSWKRAELCLVPALAPQFA